MRLNYQSTPIKIYKTTLSVIMEVTLFVALIAFCVWVIISEFSWIILICMGIMSFFCINQMVYYIRCRHERIVITEQFLIISQCVKQTDSRGWNPVKNVQISWKDINYIMAQWEHPTSKSIRKNVLVSVRKRGKEEVYLIDPDIFDVFFLEKKLQKYHRQYGQ